MKLSDKNRNILLDDLRKKIENYAEHYAKDVFSETPRVAPFGEAEIQAYEMIKNNPAGFRAFLERLLQAQTKEVFFDFFCTIDGVGDPDDKDWKGVLLIDKPEGFDDHVEFLHDQL
jgi:hypothetical protein